MWKQLFCPQSMLSSLSAGRCTATAANFDTAVFVKLHTALQQRRVRTTKSSAGATNHTTPTSPNTDTWHALASAPCTGDQPPGAQLFRLDGLVAARRAASETTTAAARPTAACSQPTTDTNPH